ncbi:MAG: hypothetical protein DA328_09345 [Nitrososphaeraceae archaeon]|nr:hypothetical protein [Nitrososphaeraceae archaeon]
MNLKNWMIFAVLSFGIVALVMSSYNSTFQSAFIKTYAQENEAEVEANIEQENKCKKDSECENENELNNQLSITNITQTQTAESQTTLNVIKIVRCELLNDREQQIPCPGGIVPEAFTIIVEGNNPSPSQFQGSEEGTIVTIGVGGYTVSETADSEGLLTDFSGDCTQTGPHIGEGNIAEGEEQTCTVTNTFLIDST